MVFTAGTRVSAGMARWTLLSILLTFACGVAAQQSVDVTVRTTSLPKGFVRQQYRFQLRGDGGITPLMWKLTSGKLPAGLGLSSNGVLRGSPTETGVFDFTVTVRDNGSPAHERNQDLKLEVVASLSIHWGRYPKVGGHRVEGSIKISNQTAQDFDLTMIVVAVNETGRATALGYQRFTLKANTVDMEIPFGENLPQGSYAINADVVGEVAATNTIYRARLTTHDKLPIVDEL